MVVTMFCNNTERSHTRIIMTNKDWKRLHQRAKNHVLAINELTELVERNAYAKHTFLQEPVQELKQVSQKLLKAIDSQVK